MRHALTTCALAAGILGGASAPAAEPAVYKRLSGWEAESLRDALRGAQRRLATSGCQQVFADFSDASGHTLRENIERLGHTPKSYLDLLDFYDAAGRSRCDNPNILAMASPGNRTIFLCAAQFAKARQTHRELTEIVLIHEALHSLGLGENPPSSTAITAQVMARCW